MVKDVLFHNGIFMLSEKMRPSLPHIRLAGGNPENVSIKIFSSTADGYKKVQCYQYHRNALHLILLT